MGVQASGEHAPFERVAEPFGEHGQRVPVELGHRLSHRARIGVDEPDRLLLADDRRGHEGPCPIEHSDSAWVAAHILDEDRRAAPQHLGFAQPGPELIGLRPVSVGWVHALCDQRASLQAEDGRARKPGSLAERPGGAREENRHGGRATQAPKRLAHPQ